MDNLHIVHLDNVVTLCRLRKYEGILSSDERLKLIKAIDAAINQIDQDIGLPGFDVKAAFQEFFGRSW